MSEHSWTWLTPRMTGRKVTSDSGEGKSRAPLPAMEALDDRVMLSATTAAGSTDLNAVLIGLIKASTPVIEGELSLAKLALVEDKRKDKWLPVMKADFANIDSLLFNYGIQFVKGKLATNTAASLRHNTGTVFAKMHTLLAKFAPHSTDLAPAQQKVRDAALGLVSTLSQFKVVVEKNAINFVKVANDVQTIDQTVLSLGENLLLNGKVALDKQLAAKVSDIFQKAQTLVKVKLGGDQALLAAVQDAQTQINDFLTGLNGGVSFKGGPMVVSNGDVIR